MQAVAHALADSLSDRSASVGLSCARSRLSKDRFKAPSFDHHRHNRLTKQSIDTHKSASVIKFRDRLSARKPDPAAFED